MTSSFATLGAVIALLVTAGCQTGPRPEAIENENKNLHGIVEQQQLRIDELTADRVSLDRRVKELEAQLSKVESTEKIVEKAKEEISEQVRQVMERFRGDSDIEVEQTSTGYRFVLREAVLFPTGAADLTAEGKRALQRVADALKGSNDRISIEGHTDDVPVKKPETLKKFPRGNLDLSLGRALAVWDYLVGEANVARSRVSVCGHGPNRPRVRNDSETNRWRNRRVEILVEGR